ncbi:XRE family transcriptional regulator [Gordonia sp. FQ]|uniref:XRE family transcriptional regulator n=1 Tax=Gordonia sp. FQ TaxID=3446634 RepID=UPI003F84273A
MTLDALSIAEVADRLDMPLERLRTRVRRGQFPEPDVIIGADSKRPVRGWTAETVDAWERSQPDKRPG